MDSRAKFEEWLNNPIEEDAEAKALVTNDVDEISWLYEIAWHAWRAGRKSMREEAAKKCMIVEADENHTVCIDYDTALSLSEEISKIEP